MKILQVCAYDSWGGAARVASGLWRGFRDRGHDSWLAVGHSFRKSSGTYVIPKNVPRGEWSRFWSSVSRAAGHGAGRIRGAGRLSNMAASIAEWDRISGRLKGSEDFDYPGTAELLSLTPERPDLVHLHNLHIDYFDLRELPRLSAALPVVLNLHDQWLMTGHCAYSIDCERWRSGCGECPDLARYPAIRRDNTASNWRRKREIYSAGRFHVTAPSRWLLSTVENSMLGPSVTGARVIPNGIDLSIFHPGDREKARAENGIPRDARVVLFAADDLGINPYKDFATVREAAERVHAGRFGKETLFIALGGLPRKSAGTVPWIRHVPRIDDPNVIASYYRAADLYLHAARGENFPNVILEALACGVPVVATAVGGIPEQVTDATGVLVPKGDSRGMAAAVEKLLGEPEARSSLGRNAAADARARFDVKRQIDSVLDWYGEILT